MSTTKNNPANSKPPASSIPIELPPVPDFLGQRARVDSTANMLQAAQAQIEHLHKTMLVNGWDESTIIHQAETPSNPHPDPITYGERIKELEDGMTKLLAESADIHEELALEASRRRRVAEVRLDRMHEKQARGEDDDK